MILIVIVGHNFKICSAAEKSVKRITLQEMEELKRQLEQERNKRMEVEKEFEIQVCFISEIFYFQVLKFKLFR